MRRLLTAVTIAAAGALAAPSGVAAQEAAPAAVFTAADADRFASAWLGEWVGSGRERAGDGTYETRTVTLSVSQEPNGVVRFVSGDGSVFDARFEAGGVTYVARPLGAPSYVVSNTMESFEIDEEAGTWAFVARVMMPGPDGTLMQAEELQAAMGGVITRRLTTRVGEDARPTIVMDMRFTRVE